MPEPILYIVEVDLPPQALEEFSDWYAGVHAPHLFQAGFTACASYRALAGGMAVLDIYEAPDWSIFESAGFLRYRSLAARDPYRPAMLAEAPEMRTVYHPAEQDQAALFPVPDADWLTLWRIDPAAGAEQELADWLPEGHRILAEAGAARSILLRRGRDTPTGRSSRPALALLAEWRDRPPATVTAGHFLPSSLRQALTDETPFLGYRLYPWPEGSAPRARFRQRLAEFSDPNARTSTP